jgi:hypothetical protein
MEDGREAPVFITWGGVVNLEDVFITGGTAGSGINNDDGKMTLNNVAITNCQDKGGILNGGEMTLNNVTITGNYALGPSAGITNSGTMTLTNVTINDNLVDGWGGGISNSGEMILINVTISGNQSEVDWAAAILNAGTMTLINVTINDNYAPKEPAGIENYASIILKNTIVANSLIGSNCWGEITSLGHNLDSDGSCALSEPSDLSNIDPMLGLLQDNGGLTQTHALLLGSPAIDAGDNTECPATNQRGISRPQDGDGDGIAICDIGSYELVITPPTIEVEIDIKPGSMPNCFNNDGHGVIPVAILSRDDFDATQVDPVTVFLDGNNVRVVGKGNTQAHIEDANGDMLDDLVVQIEDIDSTYMEGDTTAVLTGETYDGTPIEGSDSICIVP